MNTDGFDLQTADLMTAISNNLNKRFFTASKNVAKQQYQALESGEEIPFMDVNVKGQDDISCSLGLDHSQFVGGLNFSRFRDALASHLERIGVQLRNKADLNVYTADESPDVIINVPGFVQTGDTLNILVTGIEQPRAGSIIVRLMFLDPTLIKKPEQ